MLVIAGRVQIQLDKREEAIRHMQAMAEASQAEDGCHDYTFYADLDDPAVFFLFEHWESQEALDRHFETDHMAAFRKIIPEFAAGEFELKRYKVSSVADI